MKYAAFALSTFRTRFVYRSQVWAALLGQLIVMFAFVAIWTSIYAGRRNVEGTTLADMITYALIAGTVSVAWRYTRMVRLIGAQIKTGDVAVFLLKPVRYPAMLFANECGNLIFEALSVAAPVTLVIGFVYGLQSPADPFCGAMFVAYWLLSFVIMFLLAAIVGILSFWLMTAESLEWFLQGLLNLLAGTFIPLWLFPDAVAGAVRILPFAWISFYPAAVYLGRIGHGEILSHALIGAGWALVLAGTAALLWRQAALRIVVQGG